MRIIGGSLKGRRFSPAGNKWPTRPTTDYAREALFNILSNKIDFHSGSMLDLFGGFGGHSFEFISRGGRHVTFIDKYRKCTAFVDSVAKDLQIEDKLSSYSMDAIKFLKSCEDRYNYVFADPPFSFENYNDLLKAMKKVTASHDSLVVVEHGPSISLEHYDGFFDARSYGEVNFTFFRGLMRS